MHYSRKNKGTCSSAVSFNLENGIITDVSFLGGCNGNTAGIAKLCEGMKAENVVAHLKGVRCGFRGTSCPDQLAQAIEEALKEEIN